jgi:hypothetical protein
MSPFQKNTASPVSLFAGLSPESEQSEEPCRGMVGFRSCRVNGTIVLDLTPLQIWLLARVRFNVAACDWLDTPARDSVAWKIALGRRSSVVERGSHNP